MTFPAAGQTSAPRWAVTMFSFTNEMFAGPRSTSELLASVLAAQIAGAVEVDAAQHFPSFPRISENEIEDFRAVVDAFGATPTMLGGYVDARVGPPGPRSDAEKADFLRPQLRAAARMGFFAVRVGLGTLTPSLAEELLPELDALDIHLLEEVQAGALPDAPAIERTHTLRAARSTDRLGFVFDASLIMQDVPVTWIAALEADGVPRDMVDEVRGWWLQRDPQGWSRTQELMAALSLGAAARRRLEMPFRRFGCSRLEQWVDFLPSVASVHLKYWDLEDADARVSEPTRQLLQALSDSGFTGFVCSEWGGHDWLETEEHNAFDMSLAHRELVGTLGAIRP